MTPATTTITGSALWSPQADPFCLLVARTTSGIILLPLFFIWERNGIPSHSSSLLEMLISFYEKIRSHSVHHKTIKYHS